MGEKKYFFLFELILIFLIILTPLFYGTLLPLPLSIFQLASFSLFFILILKIFISSPAKILYPEGNAFILFFFILVTFQLLPLPSFILKIISPKTLELYRKYFFGFSEPGFWALSIYSLSTKQELIKTISFFLIFLITLNVVEKRCQFERLFLTIILWAAVLSLYGVIRKYFLLEKELAESFSVFGNRNHFAGFMAMVAPLALGYSLSCVDKFKRLFFVFLSTIICAGVGLSLSRGGIISLTLSLIPMLLIFKKGLIIRRKYWVFLLVMAAGIYLISFAGLDTLKMRFLSAGKGITSRGNVIKDSFGIIKDFPFFGVGLGNFRYIFSIYKSFPSPKDYYHLHNEYFQLITETGLFGFCFWAIFFITTFKTIIIKLKDRREPFVKNMVVGGLCGLLAVTIHSLVDFNFHIPATSFLFWLILGLIYKCVHTSFHK